MGGFEDDRAGCSGLLDLEPTRGANAPVVAGLEAGEAVLEHRGAKVVAESLGDAEELFVDDAADGVDAEVVRAGFAASGAVEAGHGLAATDVERLTEYVAAAGFDGFGNRHVGLTLSIPPLWGSCEGSTVRRFRAQPKKANRSNKPSYLGRLATRFSSASSMRVAHAGQLYWWAFLSAVSPFFATAAGSAPSARSSRTTFSIKALRMSGVLPFLSRASMSAPAARRALIASGW